MTARYRQPDGSSAPVCSSSHGTDDTGDAVVCRTCEVVEPLLLRADLISQLLWIGYAHVPAEDEG
jgi:hypothetical protein